MERSAISIYFILGLFIFICNSQKIFAQKAESLKNEQYLVINSIFKDSPEKSIKIYHSTIGFEEWMNFLNEDQFKDLEVIGYCNRENSEFKQAYDAFINLISGLKKKELESCNLDTKFKLIKNSRKKGVTFISEPILIGNFSFQFLKYFENKVLQVQKKSSTESWDYECGIYFPTNLY